MPSQRSTCSTARTARGSCSSIVGEIAFEQQWNFFVILEGAPFQQSERALFTNVFSRSMVDTDYRIYARSGLTYKF